MLGAAVCGVSVDRVERLSEFAGRYRLPFPLLSDRHGRVAARYGSLLNLGLFRFARRNTFLVDPEGFIARRYLRIQPARAVADLVPDLRLLVKGDAEK